MASLNTMVTAELVRRLFHYDRDTGVFTRAVKTSPRVNVGDRAGWVDKDGYRVISIYGKTYRAARLAWLHVTGAWPVGEVDHRDTDKSHDWFENLRDVTTDVNRQNDIKPQRNNKAGLLGVRRVRSGRWNSQIRINGRVCNLGTFDSPEQAHAAYVSAKRKHHKGCTL